MSDMNFVCPLLWQHVSCHPDGDLRVCCHGLGQNKIADGLNIFNSNADVLNHPTYQSIRKEMLEGQVPEVCRSCHEIEKIGGQSPRLKYVAGTGDQMEDFLEQTESDGSFKGPVHELDLTLGNSCNLKCRMCSPVFSDKLKDTFDTMGLSYNKQTVEKIKERWNGDNIVIPLLKENSIQSLVFQGGEPLLYRHHLKILRELVDSGRSSKIELSYDTNLTVLPGEVVKLWKEFKHVEVDVSLDGVEKTFEYIRYGSIWNKIESNLNELLSLNLKNLSLQFSTLIQAGMIHNLFELIQFCQKLPGSFIRIPKFTLIESPEFLSLNATSQSVIERALQDLKNINQESFSLEEKAHYDELLKLMGTYEFDADLHFKFLAHTKGLDKLNSNAPSYFELIKTH